LLADRAGPHENTGRDRTKPAPPPGTAPAPAVPARYS